MLSQTAWATGFLTQLLFQYLKKQYPVAMQKIDPRAFFTGMEGYESIKDPQALLIDRHSWLPEEVLREVLRVAEQVTGRKDVAYQASVAYFTQLADHRGSGTPSIFEIITQIFGDVRTMGLVSSLWANAYTTFLQLQAIVKDPEASELILLSRCPETFHPLIATHYMLKGNYEGFVKLYDFIEEAHLEEEFFQYHVRDIVAEFENYHIEEKRTTKILDRHTHETIVILKPVELGYEEVPFSTEAMGDISSASPETGNQWIVAPREGRWKILVPRPSASRTRINGSARALQVVQAGTLHSGRVEYHFREGALYDAPYSRYRFHWKQRPHPPLQEPEIERRIQKMTGFLFDYLEELKATQQRLLAYAVENKALTTENTYLRQKVDEQWASQTLLGESSVMKDVLALVRQVAPSDAVVMITGETGTGKELVARLIHEYSPRRSGRFVAINCAAIPEGLLESELFGHEKGAFTGATGRRLGRFELAHEGTLFLDEVGDISLTMQVKLLRVLQERTFERVGGNQTIQVDVRIVSATHQNLHDLVSSGRFRKDLFYRLNVIPIELPLLRDRSEDIPLLAGHFLKKCAAKSHKQLRHLSPEAVIALKGYSWLGNVRELENIMERVVTLAPSDQTTLTIQMLPAEFRTHSEVPQQPHPTEDWIERMDWDGIMHQISSDGSIESVLRRIEWGLAKKAIRVHGNKSQAARALKRTYRWIRKLEKRMEHLPNA